MTPHDPRTTGPYEPSEALAEFAATPEPPTPTGSDDASRPRGRRDPWRGATIASVEPGGPAAQAGLEPGMRVTHVNGVELRDIIDWDWESDGFDVELDGVAYEGTPDEFEFTCDVERDYGQDWGLSFDGVVFDGMRLCRNNCTFCFMKMLPKGMRKTLYLRDDDYRLSFLQGNFVTLTNVTDADAERIVERALSPLNVSLHAVSPDVRARLIGRNAARGIEVLERILAGGIEVHAQIVLVPGENDGDELRRTLDYVEARPLITSLGIVPLGFTRFQDTFSASYSSDPAAARAVCELVRPYQLRSRAKEGRTRYQLADEFYLAGGVEPPAAEEYDGYPQYYDGIGMVRSYLDEMVEARADAKLADRLARGAEELRRRGLTLLMVAGEAAAPLAGRFAERLGLGGAARPVAVENRYFGGNVDVAGLLTATDVLGQLPEDLSGRVVSVPDVMLNADALTLDGVPASELLASLEDRGAARAFVCPTTALAQARAICDAVEAL
ncbi:MAG: DUF512 domain-containing protein [Coriobacteriia bacterium]|nr:DUF512 domain-containing protein [Coriobacteriia bacterium]MBS5478248.1 DUF512 domain-containing protein [Coriobacteriia bacterium]